MAFSYNDPTTVWCPGLRAEDKQIRILELEPPRWYLRWLPNWFVYMIPLRGTLKWMPLETTKANTKSGAPQADSEDNHCVTPYKTLSYTWGDDHSAQSIEINGKQLKITGSLAYCLYQMRPRTKPLKIWIDQISINQLDENEKAEQVGLMDRIYQNTEETVVWLGPTADGSGKVMDVLNKFGAFAEKFELLKYYTQENYPKLIDIEKKVNAQDPKTVEYHTFCESNLHLFDYSFFESFIAFQERPWFKRAWVVQEFALPPKAVLKMSDKSIEAEILMVVLQMIRLTISGMVIDKSLKDPKMMKLLDKVANTDAFHPLLSARRRKKAWDEGRNDGQGLYQVLQTIHIGQSFQATHGCDMIFGLLGLANDAKDLGIEVDYSGGDSQVQTASAYTLTAKAIITSGQSDLLKFAQHIKKDIELPSWVPDWRSDIKFSFSWQSDVTKPPVFHACANQPLELCQTSEDRILSLKGYKVDEVEELGGPWISGTEDGVSASIVRLADYLNFLAQVRQMCLLSNFKNHSIYTSTERRDEAIWRIPVGDLDYDDSYDTCRATQACKYGFEQCMAQIELEMQAPALASLEEHQSHLARVTAMGQRTEDDDCDIRTTGATYRTRLREMRGKRPFLSRIGYVGMGPQYMQAGDLIVVLTGASVPFVVRPLGNDQFRLLGECYCDGIMDGEIVDKRSRETITLI